MAGPKPTIYMGPSTKGTPRPGAWVTSWSRCPMRSARTSARRSCRSSRDARITGRLTPRGGLWLGGGVVRSGQRADKQHARGGAFGRTGCPAGCVPLPQPNPPLENSAPFFARLSRFAWDFHCTAGFFFRPRVRVRLGLRGTRKIGVKKIPSKKDRKYFYGLRPDTTGRGDHQP